MRDVLLATRNRGKLLELGSRLAGLPVRLHTLDEFSLPPVEETGSTFEENAAIKAVHCSRLVDWLVLGEDSGLEVDALAGQPGIQSARFGGPGLTDQQRCHLLLEKLDGTAWEERRARFVCVAVLAQGGQPRRTFRGTVEGLIAFEPRGTSGFGYDPVFYYPPGHKTFAEMTSDEKTAVSHRGKVLEQCVRYFEEMGG